MRSPFAFSLLLVFVSVDRGSCFDNEELVIVTEQDDTPSFSSAETYFPSPPSQFPSSLLPTKENTQAFLPIKPPFTDKEKCFGELGCFAPFPPSNIFISIVELAGIGLFPSEPESVDTTFFLYSCANRYRPHRLRWNSTEAELTASPFDPRKRTVFIIHGFMDSYQEMNWMGDLKDYILNVKNQLDLAENSCNYNVFGVDWRGGSQTAIYPNAVANTQMVAACIFRLINKITKLHGNLSPSNFTLVGHSLGSHVAGFVGERFKGDNETVQSNKTRRTGSKKKPATKIGRIIGLDPAGPGFNDIPETHRLDPSDGQLVLTIHTNGGKVVADHFGIETPLGHYSFFPNGGGDQPGCEKTRGISNILMDGLIQGLTDTIACSHRRATLLVQFNESLLTTAQAMAYSCPDYDTFTAGQCGAAQCNSGGEVNPDGSESLCKPFSSWFDFWAEYRLPASWSAPVSLFVDTSDLKPFTVYHYQVVLSTRSNFTSFNGAVSISPIGSRRDWDTVTINPGTIAPNSTYTYLIKVPKSLGKISTAMVSLKSGIGLKMKRVKKEMAPKNKEGKWLWGTPATNDRDKAQEQEQEDQVNQVWEVIGELQFNYMSHLRRRTREVMSTVLVPTNTTAFYHQTSGLAVVMKEKPKTNRKKIN